jgi:hypothetical protein
LGEEQAPTTAKPSGRRASAPAPKPRATGRVPVRAAIAIIMIAFLLTMPISMMIPTKE